MNQNLSTRDVVIVGASLAGITTAYLLGQAGARVTIIDPQEFPRKKACGEGLSLLGVRHLQGMGLWSYDLAEQAYPFCGYEIHFENGETAELKRRDVSIPHGFAVSRLSLDTSIHQKVSALRNVSFLTDTVLAITESRGIWTVKTSSQEEFLSHNLIVACGSSHSLSRLFPHVSMNSIKTPRFGVALWCKGQWNNQVTKLVQIHHAPEGQYIITPLSVKEVNVSILLSKQKSSDLAKQQIVEKALGILERSGFQAENISDTLGAPSIHSSRLITHREKLLPYFIGDSVERFDPIGGMGMTHALYSAGLAANELLLGSTSTEYFRKRRYGAAILRQLTGISFALNVSQSKLLQSITQKSPKLALQSIELLEQAFPKPIYKFLTEKKFEPKYTSLREEVHLRGGHPC